MSCTVVAIPYALAWVIGTMVATSSALISEVAEKAEEQRMSQYAKQIAHDCDDVQVITDKHFIEKDFETPFVDNEILKKTLEEHGVRNINENEFTITGQVDNYSLTFQKKSMEEPYSLRITCLSDDNPEEKIEDLNSEYAMNVQEDAYLHILE